MPIINIENVYHAYSPGTPMEAVSLRELNIEVPRGEFLALAGPTGSGKSTLAQLLNGLLLPTRGRVLVKGMDTREKKVRQELWRLVGLVFQYPEDQFFEENVYKEVAFGPSNMDLSPGEITDRVRESLEMVGLDFNLVQNQSPWALSGGQRRRVALASVLASRPEVLVLDEPTAGIDPAGRRRLLKTVKALQKRNGLTVVLITHNMDDIAQVADRVLVLVRGSVYACGAVREVFSMPEDLRSVGLDVPFASDLMYKLKSAGIPVGTGALNLDEAEMEIKKYLRSGKKKNPC